MLNARQLGHSSVTEGIYGHWSRTASRREAQKMGTRMNALLGPPGFEPGPKGL